MSKLSAKPHFGPRTVYSYIHEQSKQLNSLKERQKALIDAYLTTPDPARQITSAPRSHPVVAMGENVSQGSNICGGPIRSGRGRKCYHQYRQLLQDSDIALKVLVTQAPDAQIDIRMRYLHQILIHLDQVFDSMHFEQG
ncbi:hypothetical protein BGX24_006538 [Mortierella sp. AD032]|nr:hypothetical protein BGX24_006538 [Mortierella sp. AD032]